MAEARRGGAAIVRPAALLVAALLVAGQARPARAEVGISLQTAVPLTMGLELAAGGHLAWEVALAGGFTPPLYVGIIQGLADDQVSSDVIDSTLDSALSAQAMLRFFPVQGFGLFLEVGYDVFWVSGTVEPSEELRQSVQPLEEPDTGSNLPGGGGGGGSGGGGSGFDPQNPGKPPIGGGDSGGGTPAGPVELPPPQEVSSTIHALHAGLGYRQFLGNFYFQGQLAVLKAVKASSSPDELPDGTNLNELYTENLLVPYLGIAFGMRI